MTVTYTAEVATSRGLGCFWKLLFRWRGSVYKLVWPDLLLFCGLYTILSFIYRVALTEPQKRYFEKISLYCESFVDLIPIAFVLGFYVSIVVARWWDSYMTIPWPDRMAIFVTANVHGLDDRGRLMRRTIMRYINLSLLITFTCISSVVKKRFPTLDHLVEAGILLPNEKKILEELGTPHPKYWMPLVWCTSLVTRARKEGRIRDDFALKTLLDEINSFRGGCGGLFNYDWISIPLVYTQVVTLAVYTFFMTCLFGRQFLDPSQSYTKHTVDIYVPIFTLLQYMFYMGWLKVAESLVNPFGEDDDDFEMNWLVDRNLQVSYLIVDEMHQEHPELIKDQYWDEIMPEMPYTAAAEQFKTEPHMGSAAGISVPDHEANFVIPSSIIEEEDEDRESIKTVLHEGDSSTPTESHPMRILSRQLSGSSHGSSQMGSSHMTNRPSMLSMLQRMFSRTRRTSNSLSGSQMSLKQQPVRSTSKMSYTSQSPTPQSPTLSHPDQDEIFKMSDLSININRNDVILDLLEKEQFSHTKKKPPPYPSDSKTKLGKKLSSESNTNQDADHSTKEDSQEESPQNEMCNSCNQKIRTKSRRNLEELHAPNISSSSTPSHHKKLRHSNKPEKLHLTARDSITSLLLSPTSDLQSPPSTDSPGVQDSKSGDSRPSSPFFSSLKKKVHTLISPLAKNNSTSNLSSPTNELCEIRINESEPQNSTDNDKSNQLIPGLSTPSHHEHLPDESVITPSHKQIPLKKYKQESTSFAELSTILEQGSPDVESNIQPKRGPQTIAVPSSSSNNSQRSHSIPNRLSDHGKESHLLISQPKPSRQRTISEGTVLQPKSSLSRFFSFKKNL